jgi:hypothetical protein
MIINFSILQPNLILTVITIAVQVFIFDLNLGFFTGDRLDGLRQLPKRPWEAFKDPENTIKRVAYKHNRNNPNF